MWDGHVRDVVVQLCPFLCCYWLGANASLQRLLMKTYCQPRTKPIQNLMQRRRNERTKYNIKKRNSKKSFDVFKNIQKRIQYWLPTCKATETSSVLRGKRLPSNSKPKQHNNRNAIMSSNSSKEVSLYELAGFAKEAAEMLQRRMSSSNEALAASTCLATTFASSRNALMHWKIDHVTRQQSLGRSWSISSTTILRGLGRCFGLTLKRSSRP